MCASLLNRSQPIAPFCDYLNDPDVTKYSCNVDRSAVGYCNLQIYSNTTIPAEYQVMIINNSTFYSFYSISILELISINLLLWTILVVLNLLLIIAHTLK